MTEVGRTVTAAAVWAEGGGGGGGGGVTMQLFQVINL